MIQLSQPDLDGGPPLTAVLSSRRSSRDFGDTPLDLRHLGQILWAAQGVTTTAGGRRTAPSAEASYPLELVVGVGEVVGVEPGLYRYEPTRHCLDQIVSADPRPRFQTIAYGDQPWLADAAAAIVIAAGTAEMDEHFRHQQPPGRGTRYAMIEAGAASQNAHLQADALGLGMVLVGGFDDAALATLIELEDGSVPVALIALGSTT